MFGLTGKMRAHPGKGAELIASISGSTETMPSCRSHVIAEDATDPDGIWITEVWDTQEQHKASLQIPAVKASIAKAMPLIAGFDSHVVTKPVAGV
jgi:quinol monooxygenase YgiN